MLFHETILNEQSQMFSPAILLDRKTARLTHVVVVLLDAVPLDGLDVLLGQGLLLHPVQPAQDTALANHKGKYKKGCTLGGSQYSVALQLRFSTRGCRADNSE